MKPILVCVCFADCKSDKLIASAVTTMADASTVSVPLGDGEDVEFRGGNLYLNRDRPFSSSQHSTASSKSVVSQNPNMVISTTTANNLFSFRVSRCPW